MLSKTLIDEKVDSYLKYVENLEENIFKLKYWIQEYGIDCFELGIREGKESEVNYVKI